VGGILPSGRWRAVTEPASGTYRIVYRIEEDTRTVHVLDIVHRAGIYRLHA
jgi:hypothetical protein